MPPSPKSSTATSPSTDARRLERHSSQPCCVNAAPKSWNFPRREVIFSLYESDQLLAVVQTFLSLRAGNFKEMPMQLGYFARFILALLIWWWRRRRWERHRWHRRHDFWWWERDRRHGKCYWAHVIFFERTSLFRGGWPDGDWGDQGGDNGRVDSGGILRATKNAAPAASRFAVDPSPIEL